MNKLIAIRLPEELIARMKAEGNQTRIIRESLEARYANEPIPYPRLSDPGPDNGSVLTPSSIRKFLKKEAEVSASCLVCGGMNGMHQKGCKE